MTGDIPFPPLALRKIVGPVEDFWYDNPTGDYVWGTMPFVGRPPEDIYDAIFDFGCGCGRNARQLMLQRDPPRRYVGIDIAPELIAWCQKNLAPIRPDYQFLHHDVFNPTYAPENTKQLTAPFPVEDNAFSLFNAHSVFTHVYWEQTKYTRVFPVLDRARQFCIYVNETDPSQAVYYDVHKVLELFEELELSVVHVEWTTVYGYQTVVYLGHRRMHRNIAGDLEIPDTVVGANARPELLFPM